MCPSQLQFDFEVTLGAPLRNTRGATQVVGALGMACNLGQSLGLRRAPRFVLWAMKAGMYREARPRPHDGFQTPSRVALAKGITMSVRRSVIPLTLTAVALSVTSSQAAGAQQTAPASATAVFDVADRHDPRRSWRGGTDL